MLWRKPGKSKRKRPISQLRSLIKKLDRVFSEYVRRRDADRNGFASCCTCGVKQQWKEMDAGHFVARNRMAVRYCEENCHAQCRADNRFRAGCGAEYALFLQRKYGPDIVERLVAAGHKVKKWSPIELEALIVYYKDEIKKMTK